MQFLNYLPRTFNGKVLKYALREATNDVPWELVGDTTTKDGTHLEVMQEKMRVSMSALLEEMHREEMPCQ